MKHLSEYRDRDLTLGIVEEIRRRVRRGYVLMEICGGQTHSFVRSGLDALLPREITLVHGPGCPVCVTPLGVIDRAMLIAARPGVIFASFGDMLRVPGSNGDLLAVRAGGGDVRAVYSPLDAVALAAENPGREVVFFAIGFETTAPANAMSVLHAAALGLANYSVLVSHSCVPGAVCAILGSPGNRVQALLAAGHVCAIAGVREYEPIAADYRVPVIVTGFEPVDLARGVLAAVRQLNDGRAEVENAYARVVGAAGNLRAQEVVAEVFEPCDREWRGMGVIERGGLRLRERYAAFDAERRFDVGRVRSVESPRCLAGEVLRGLRPPTECPCFGVECTPAHPLGATMVSSEGACAAYYKYRTPGAAGSAG